MLVCIVTLFAIGTSILSWDNARTLDLAPRFHWPDETSNSFFAERIAQGEPIVITEPRNVDAENLIHPRTANVRDDGAIVPGSYLGLPLWYGLVGRAAGARTMLFLTPILAAIGLLALASIIRRLAGATVAVTATVFLSFHPTVWLFTATTFLPNVPFVALLLTGFAVLLRASSSLRGPLHNHPPCHSDDRREEESRTSKWTRFFVSLRMTPLQKSLPLERRRLPAWSLQLIAGGLIGLALTIRTHELLWVGAILVMLVWRSVKRAASNSKHLERSPLRAYSLRLTAYGFGLVLPFIPILILNTQLYGSPFTTGYALLQDGGAAPTEFVASWLPGWLAAFIAPFGWHPIEAFERFWQYMVVPYWWFIALAAMGMIAVCTRRASSPPSRMEGGKQAILSPPHDGRGSDSSPEALAKGERGWAVGTILLTAWLILYYGSWTIADPLVRETNVLTISYVRYWIPITIVLAFWAAVGFRWVLDHCVARWRPSVAMLMLLGIAFTSFAQIVTNPTEGLLRQREAIAEHRVRSRAVIAATERDAVIISHRMDKVFFPERAVVHTSVEFDADFRRRLATLLIGTPVYWYATGAPPPSSEFVLTPVGAMPFDEQLYRVRVAKPERGWKGSARPPRMGEAGVAQGAKPIVKVL